jgi:hypothetical protein
MTQALYAHMNKKKKKKRNIPVYQTKQGEQMQPRPETGLGDPLLGTGSEGGRLG